MLFADSRFLFSSSFILRNTDFDLSNLEFVKLSEIVVSAFSGSDSRVSF